MEKLLEKLPHTWFHIKYVVLELFVCKTTTWDLEQLQMLIVQMEKIQRENYELPMYDQNGDIVRGK